MASVLVDGAGPAVVGDGSETVGLDRTLAVLAAGPAVAAGGFGWLVRSRLGDGSHHKR